MPGRKFASNGQWRPQNKASNPSSVKPSPSKLNIAKPPAARPPPAKPSPAKAAFVPSSNNKTTTHSVRGPPNPPAAKNRPHPSAAKPPSTNGAPNRPPNQVLVKATGAPRPNVQNRAPIANNIGSFRSVSSGQSGSKWTGSPVVGQKLHKSPTTPAASPQNNLSVSSKPPKSSPVGLFANNKNSVMHSSCRPNSASSVIRSVSKPSMGVKSKSVASPQKPAFDSTSDKRRKRTGLSGFTKKRVAASQLKELQLKQYSRNMVWRDTDHAKPSLTSETAAPLPLPPNKKSLKNHRNPNQLFVRSAVRGLRKGVWPFADTSDPKLPTTADCAQPLIRKKAKAEFVRRQVRDKEVKLGRASKPFGKKLLPGMRSSPIRPVPKSTPGKFRLVVD